MATAKKKPRTVVKAGMEAAMTGTEFKAIRKALGLSQEGLSERTGIHRITIIRYESGDYPIFRPVAELMRCLNRERKARG